MSCDLRYEFVAAFGMKRLMCKTSTRGMRRNHDVTHTVLLQQPSCPHRYSSCLHTKYARNSCDSVHVLHCDIVRIGLCGIHWVEMA